MTSPEQPDTPPLTRKQLREIRNTGATPIISAPSPGDDDLAASPPAPEPAPLPRAAVPMAVPIAPIPDAAVDLDSAPLTRRQARQQERIRTASVPVITPAVAAAHAAETAADGDADVDLEAVDESLHEVVTPAASDEEVTDEDVVEAIIEVDDQQDAADEVEDPDAGAAHDDETVEESERVVSPLLGASVIAGEPVEVDLPPSFDQLLARGSAGAVGAPNALILSQATGDLPMVGPVTATGEVLITGTLNLPEGLGSMGHAPGAADGKDVDAVLIDGELPAHSSPTPIAASAAISTVKSAGEVIRPPAPEKGSRLMLWLAITAGALALALVGVLILAFVNGVF